MTIGLIIVGDEILSGKRQDKHLPTVIDLLKVRGLALDWVAVLGDHRERLAATLRRTFESDDIVICCGGIGGTPDDHTRQAAGLALNVPLARDPVAADLIVQRCEKTQQPVTEERLRMADFPMGSRLIPNPYNGIAGFSIQSHWFVPGFPVMAWPMIEWVLDTHYAHLHHQTPVSDRSMRVFEVAEAALTPLMESIEAQFGQVKVYSLPSVGGDGVRRHIELGVKGAPEQVQLAWTILCQTVQSEGYETQMIE